MKTEMTLNEIMEYDNFAKVELDFEIRNEDASFDHEFGTEKVTETVVDGVTVTVDGKDVSDMKVSDFILNYVNEQAVVDYES